MSLILLAALSWGGPGELDIERALVALEEERYLDARDDALEALSADRESLQAWEVYVDAAQGSGLGHRAGAELEVLAAQHPAAQRALSGEPGALEAELLHLEELALGGQRRALVDAIEHTREARPEHPDLLAPLWLVRPSCRVRRLQRALAGEVIDSLSRQEDPVYAYRARRLFVEAGLEVPASRAVERLQALGEPPPQASAPWSREMRRAVATAIVHTRAYDSLPDGADEQVLDVGSQIATMLEERGRTDEAEHAWASTRALVDSASAATAHARVLLELEREEEAQRVASTAMELASLPTQSDAACLALADRGAVMEEAAAILGSAGSAPDALILTGPHPPTPRWWPDRARSLEEGGWTDAAFSAWVMAGGLAEPGALERTYRGAGTWEDVVVAETAREHQERSALSQDPPEAEADRPRLARAGHPVPAWSLEVDGDVVDHRSLEGRVVLLAFWASWCAPCKEELPELAELARSLSHLPVSLVAVNVDEQERAYLRARTGLDLNGLLVGRDPGLMARFQVSSLPSTWIITANGTAHELVVGYKKGQRGRLEDKIRALIQER